MNTTIGKVLITQSRLRNFAGSEMATLELADYFSKKGSIVTVLTNYVEDPLKQELINVPNVKLVLTTTSEAEAINVSDYDLVWIHHSLLNKNILESLVELRRDNKGPRVVFSHMSYIEPLEFPVCYRAENSLADVVLFNAEEIKDKIAKQGVTFSQATTMIFPNPAPDSFFEPTPSKSDNKLNPTKVAVISNHIPAELYDAVSRLRDADVEVDLIGKGEGSTPRHVTSELLGKYDLVVSIGKTVQYCIAADVPVYCYDHFGGSGFLTEKNYATNKYHNFSGRGFDKKTADEIVQDIIEEYPTGKTNFSEVRSRHSEEFKLSEQVESILAVAVAHRDQTPIPSGDIAAYCNYVEIMNRTFPGNFKHLYQLQHIEKDFASYRQEERKKHSDQAAKHTYEKELLIRELQQLRSSRAFRLQRAYGRLKNLLRR